MFSFLPFNSASSPCEPLKKSVLSLLQTSSAATALPWVIQLPIKRVSELFSFALIQCLGRGSLKSWDTCRHWSHRCTCGRPHRWNEGSLPTRNGQHRIC